MDKEGIEEVLKAWIGQHETLQRARKAAAQRAGIKVNERRLIQTTR